MPGNFIDIIEAAYRVDDDEAVWLEGLLDAIRSVAGAPGPGWAMVYSVSSEGRTRIDRLHLGGAASGAVAGWVTRQLVRGSDGPAARFEPVSCVLASETGGVEGLLGAASLDVLGINGADPSGRGVFLGVEVPLGTQLSGDQRSMWSRVGVHVAAARRLRARSAQGPRVEARLRPDGRVEHLEDCPSPGAARRQLQRAVRAMESARGTLRRRAPAEALKEWRGLVAARWSLVDEFQENGRRYIVARENAADAPDFDRLTQRERQVVAFASLGHANKLIAYELGIATSTVGVLLSRAMAKLGLRSRKALVQAFLTQRVP
jgi:DNA-binding CsgD family transcriptional regulator